MYKAKVVISVELIGGSLCSLFSNNSTIEDFLLMEVFTFRISPICASCWLLPSHHSQFYSSSALTSIDKLVNLSFYRSLLLYGFASHCLFVFKEAVVLTWNRGAFLADRDNS